MWIMRTGSGYKLCLNTVETFEWATRPNDAWPCSTLSGKRLFVEVDSNGLCDIAINGEHSAACDGTELDAIVSDHLPADLRHLWPTWEKRGDQ